MAGVTNRGKLRELQYTYQARALPAKLFVALVTNTTPPTASTAVFSQLEEIAAGNGYSQGGIELTPGVVDFPTAIEDPTNNLARALVRNIQIAAAGGAIPSSGPGISWAVITDNNPTIADREVLRYLDVRDGTTPRTIADAQNITLTDLGLENRET